MISDTLYDDIEATLFSIQFDQSVTVTRLFYPKLSFSILFSDMGGALGFWLGLGALQLAQSFIQLIIKATQKLNIR